MERRHLLTLATKVGIYPWGGTTTHATSVWSRKAIGKFVRRVALPEVDWSVQRAMASLRQSLKRLGTDYVDFLLLHEPEIQLIQTEEFTRWLEDEVRVGAVRCWGVAGVAERVAPWVHQSHPLAKVVQTQDSLSGLEADFLLNLGRDLQFTYGYLSSARTTRPVGRPQGIIQDALARNATGSVIVSTRHSDRIAALARVVV